MKIYEINYKQLVTIDKSTLPIDYVALGIDPEGTVSEMLDSVIHVGANDIIEAITVATDYLDKESEEEYEIGSIAELDGIDVVNWQGEGEPCQCPFCRGKRVAPEDAMSFECPSCKQEIIVAVDGWESIGCPKCNISILKDRLYSIGNGKYKFIKVKED